MTDNNKENELQQGSVTASWNLSAPTLLYWSFTGERYTLFPSIILKNAAFFPSLNDEFGDFTLTFDWNTYNAFTKLACSYLENESSYNVPFVKFSASSKALPPAAVCKSIQSRGHRGHSGLFLSRKLSCLTIQDQVTVLILINWIFLLPGIDTLSGWCEESHSFHNIPATWHTPETHRESIEMLILISPLLLGDACAKATNPAPCALILPESGSASIAFTWLTTTSLQAGGQNVCKKN